MKSFLNDPKIKTKYLKRVNAHAKAEESTMAELDAKRHAIHILTSYRAWKEGMK